MFCTITFTLFLLTPPNFFNSSKTGNSGFMKGTIIRQLALPEIPSASGIEMVQDHFFVIGDDAQNLFVLNKSFQLIDKIKLFDAVINESGRISKSDKSDLEALTTVVDEGKTYLLVIGSGSIRETRDNAFLVALKDYQGRKISMVRFYDYIRSAFNNLQAGTLNIEGAVFHQQELYLFHRGNISGRNIIISIPWKDFLHFEEKGTTQSISLQQVTLPVLNGLHAGFSGASMVPGSDQLIFTASVENTSNAIDDGPSGGSYIGLLNLKENSDTISDIALLYDGAIPFLGKVESITVIQSDEHTLHVIAVCDEDGNPSQLLELKIVLKTE